MIPTSSLHILHQTNERPPLYAVRMTNGSLDDSDLTVTLVGVTDDLAKAEAYVANQQAVLASLIAKYNALGPITEAWLKDNTAPYRAPDQEVDTFYGVLAKWSHNMRHHTEQWLAANLTPEEAKLDAVRSDPRWSVEPMPWLP